MALKGSKLFIKRKFQFRYVARKNLAAFDLLPYIEQITLISSSTFFEIREYISKSCEKANILHQNYSFWTSKYFFEGVKDYCSIFKAVPQTKIYWH